MVQCLAAFIEACYIARRNAITEPDLHRFRTCVNQFYSLRQIFIDTGVRKSISLPRQHAFVAHFYPLIKMFGSPNGLCSSITESKHIKAVKEPWRRSNHFRALAQMVKSIVRMEKMAAVRRSFNQQGLLSGTVLDDIRALTDNMSDGRLVETESDDGGHSDDEADRDENKAQRVNEVCDDDQQAVEGDQSSLDDSLSDVMPASCLRK